MTRTMSTEHFSGHLYAWTAHTSQERAHADRQHVGSEWDYAMANARIPKMAHSRLRRFHVKAKKACSLAEGLIAHLKVLFRFGTCQDVRALSIMFPPHGVH